MQHSESWERRLLLGSVTVLTLTNMDNTISSTRFYRSRDNLKNFKIRINLRREVLQELSEPVNKHQNLATDGKISEISAQEKTKTKENTSWTETFSWYQKISFDHDTADRSRQVIFFTQLDQENFVDIEDMNRTVATSVAKLPVAGYQILSHTNKPQTNQGQFQFQETKPDGRYVEHNFQTMYIRGAFLMKPDYSYWKEYTLCTIRVYSDGGIEMRVHFSTP